MELWRKGSFLACVKALIFQMFLGVSVCFCGGVLAGSGDPVSAADDYINHCKYATCVGIAASEWSEKHPFGVAISVRMGTQPVVTDDQIKMVLMKDFKKHGIQEIKFFFEQNDTPATGIFLHVRGGTEGLFLIDTVRQHVSSIAERAQNNRRVFLPY